MRKVSTLVGLSLFALAGIARAQDVAPADAEAAPVGDPAAVVAPEATVAPVAAASGTSYVARGLTQTAGNLQVTVPVVLNLSKEAVLKPVWIPLDVRYGATDQLEIFLAHGSPVGFPISTPGGVCLGGEERGCGKLYDNLSLGAQFSFLKDPAMELAAIGALVVGSLDLGYYAADVGVNFKYNAGAVAIKAAPQVVIGVNKRDQGNKESLFVPVQVAFQATPELAVFLDTGIVGPLEKFGDSYSVPVGIGASFAAMPNLDVGAEFFLPRVASGMEGNKAFDSRMLALFASWRLQ
jgi:hypothetical protein